MSRVTRPFRATRCGRASPLDNGVTWQPDEAFSDVITPLPGQPDPGIVTEYVGDYDYSIGSDTAHFTSWADGRVAINNASQQDAFTDQEGGGGGGNIVLASAREDAGTEHHVQLQWSPADGGTITYCEMALLSHDSRRRKSQGQLGTIREHSPTKSVKRTQATARMKSSSHFLNG